MGYSFGGYLVSSYVIKYLVRVKYLIFVDLWGFFVKFFESNINRYISVWVKFLGVVLSFFNLLVGLRVVGFWGMYCYIYVLIFWIEDDLFLRLLYIMGRVNNSYYIVRYVGL